MTCSEFQRYIPEGIDACVLLAPIHRAYLLDFVSSAGTIVITKTASYFIIDHRYFALASGTIAGCQVIAQTTLHEQVREILLRHDVRSVGMDVDHIPLSQFESFKSILPEIDWLTDDRTERLLRTLYASKSSNAIQSIKRAGEIGDITEVRLHRFIRAGVSKAELQRTIGILTAESGSHGATFSCGISQDGLQPALEDGIYSHEPIGEGFLQIRYATKYDGYYHDRVRTVYVGKPDQQDFSTYKLVYDKLQSIGKSLSAGLKLSDVNKLLNADNEYECGIAGIGLELDEPLSFSDKDDNVLPTDSLVKLNVGRNGVVLRDILHIGSDDNIWVSRASAVLPVCGEGEAV